MTGIIDGLEVRRTIKISCNKVLALNVNIGVDVGCAAEVDGGPFANNAPHIPNAIRLKIVIYIELEIQRINAPNLLQDFRCFLCIVFTVDT